MKIYQVKTVIDFNMFFHIMNLLKIYIIMKIMDPLIFPHLETIV